MPNQNDLNRPRNPISWLWYAYALFLSPLPFDILFDVGRVANAIGLIVGAHLVAVWFIRRIQRDALRAYDKKHEREGEKNLSNKT